jgi:hypothetical protein
VEKRGDLRGIEVGVCHDSGRHLCVFGMMICRLGLSRLNAVRDPLSGGQMNQKAVSWVALAPRAIGRLTCRTAAEVGSDWAVSWTVISNALDLAVIGTHQPVPSWLLGGPGSAADQWTCLLRTMGGRRPGVEDSVG